MKNLLITGAAGFLGSHLGDEAIGRGWKVIGIDNFFRGKPQHIPKHPNFSFEKIDMLNLAEIKNIINQYKPAVIAHYAAINGTEYFYERPWQVLSDNINITMNLVKALEELEYVPQKFVYASSSEVYGEKPRQIPTKEDDLIALDIAAIRDSYASSKAFGEFVVKNFCHEKKSKYLIFRIFNTYGPRMDTSKYGQVVPEFIRKAINEEEFTIIGDGQHTRSFCYVADHARIAMNLINKSSNLVLNLGSNKETKIFDLASLICRIVEKPFNPVFLEPRTNDPLRRCPNIDNLVEIVEGPRCSLEDGLKETVKWYLRASRSSV